jgi:Ca2+-binding EF-hand superfamily protein
MKKKYMEDISNMARTLVAKLAPELEQTMDTEERDLFMTLKDTFNAFDRDGNAEMQYPEYSEAWKFLGQPGDETAIKRAFDSVDVDGSGLVDWEEFVFSIMGEKALKFGTLADMEMLQTLLGNVAQEYALLRESLQETRMSADERANRNKRLRGRLENMKSEVSGQVNDLLSKMLGIKPEDILSAEEINKHLTNAFNKFDEDRDGQLGQWEFQQAWFFLGLKGTEDEIVEAFQGVDTNNSGLVDLQEFQKAIKGERLLELNLGQVLNKLGVNYQTNADHYEAYQNAQRRRRLMKKEYEANVSKVTKDIINKLAAVSSVDVPARNAKDEATYQTLRDTFDAFDKDGSAELGYPEYVESWKFLNRPGGEQEIKKTFDSVDVDVPYLSSFLSIALLIRHFLQHVQ